MNIKRFKWTLALCIMIFFVSACLKEELNPSFHDFNPLPTNDGWDIATASEEHIDSSRLIDVYKDMYAHEKSWVLKSISVFRNNKLIAEAYPHDEKDRYKQYAMWSCTKQTVALIVGMAIKEGYITSVKDPIKKYLPVTENYPDKENVTIKNLLTMQSGIYFDNDTESDVFRRHHTESSIEYVLGNELKWQPGTHFQYNDGAPQLISAIIQNATGLKMVDYAEEKIFSEIGLTNYEWFDYPDGITMGAFGILTPPRELAKIAQLVCDGGSWRGKQVVPQLWINEMLTTHVDNAFENIDFGYLWWVNNDEGFYFMWGHGGQYAVIYPDKELVIVITSLEQIASEVAFDYRDILTYCERINQCCY